MPAAYNRNTQTSYPTLKAAMAALNGQTAQGDILLEWEGDQLCQTASIQTLNMGGYRLLIRPAGYVEGAKNNPRPTLDAGGGDICVSFNNSSNIGLGNINFIGGRIMNFNMNSESCKAISGQATKGDNVVRDVVFANGAIPIRWVGVGNGTTSQNPCGNLTIEDVSCLHGYGAFRLGLGVSTLYRDFGNVIIRRCSSYWDRRYVSNPELDPGSPTGNAPSTHSVMALKNFQSLLIEDCPLLDGSGKGMLALENMGEVTIRRCRLKNGGILNTSGGCIDYKANGGYRANITIERCLFENSRLTVVFADGANGTTGTGEIKLLHNTILEAGGNNRNIIYLANGMRLTRHYGNIYQMNDSATTAAIQFGTGTAGTAAEIWSDSNNYYKPTTRPIFAGTVGGTNLSATTLSALQAQTQGDPTSTSRDSHSTTGKPVFNKDL